MSEMPDFATGILGIFSLLAIYFSYLATSGISEDLSPQGCRMSYMSPSYILQADFNKSWSSLSSRYSLWLYREVDWDALQDGRRQDSLPVLFIPGNAGSSHQVRSIASSATRQYFSSPHVVSPEYRSSAVKPLDFYAVEFNEDLSAFHSSTLHSQISYSAQAISYILSLYPPNTQILLLGHSMGGVVATSLLPSGNVSAVITMSTPHTLPPARFDYRLDKLYDKLQILLESDPTPIISICGGAMDLMIPSESCILPKTATNVTRKTVFTSSLEGAWTGVGHREMVWCHQVRWRVARAALELGAAKTLEWREKILSRWLRDGSSLPPFLGEDKGFITGDVEVLDSGTTLRLKQPLVSKRYLLPVQRSSSPESRQKITVLVSQGSIASVSPQNKAPLHISIFLCNGQASSDCVPLQPDILKLIPNPVPGKLFPVPQEGADESEGAVFYEAVIPNVKTEHWVGIEVEGAARQGWVLAEVTQQREIRVTEISTLGIALSSTTVSMPMDVGLSTPFTFPNLISNALIVYRLSALYRDMSACSGLLLPPLLMHTSHVSETHYFSLANGRDRPILLHTHLSAPFIDHNRHFPSYSNFTILSSGEAECQSDFMGFTITVDWSTTIGRWASRYLHTLVSWAAGVASLVVYFGLAEADTNATFPSVTQSLRICHRHLIRYLLPASLLVSLLPIREWAYTGNKGILILAPIAPLILLVATGLVHVLWWLLLLILPIVGRINVFVFKSGVDHTSVPKGTIFSLLAICLVIFLFVPWQVAYVACWLLHFQSCALSHHRFSSSNRDLRVEAVPLVRRQEESGQSNVDETQPSVEHSLSDAFNVKRDNLHLNLHILVLMTWLLPLTAPVLAVWVRTLLTAGCTTPFDGDHNFLAALPFLVFTDFSSWTPDQILGRKTKLESRLSLRWPFALVAATAFVFGSRKPYLVLDVARVAMWIVVIIKIGRRYWGGQPWTI